MGGTKRCYEHFDVNTTAIFKNMFNIDMYLLKNKGVVSNPISFERYTALTLLMVKSHNRDGLFML